MLVPEDAWSHQKLSAGADRRPCVPVQAGAAATGGARTSNTFFAASMPMFT
jgi:hypothetical protein